MNPNTNTQELIPQDVPQFRFFETTATRKVFEMNKRIRAVAGGTSASKTISIMFWIIQYCETYPNKLVHVVSESYPHLEAGSMLDFQNIMTAQGRWNKAYWNETKHQYTFPGTNTKLRFYSLDVSSAHGPRRDVLFLNEANNIPMQVFDQLEPRTRETIWLDWNPSVEFWFYTDILENRSEDLDFITLTYKDNEALDPATVKSIESRQNNRNWWQVYGLGQLGEVEGRIYTGWQKWDNKIPNEARLLRYGLDFGYSNDPASIVAIYWYNGGYIIDEILYAKGMSNQRLAEILRDQERNAQVIADSAEPKSIDEIRLYGVPIIPALKGRDSINHGIQYIQDQRISVTNRSVNIWKEYRAYLWQTDKDGQITDKAQDFNNHAMDAIRYGFSSIRQPNRRPRQGNRQINLSMPR